MQGMLGLTNYTRLERAASSSSTSGAGSTESAAVAVANAICFSFIVCLGAVTGIGRVIVQGRSNGGSWAATDAVSADWAATDDEGVIILDVVKPERYDELRVSVVTDSGDTEIDSILCIRSGLRSIPPAQHSTVLDATVNISPEPA